MLLASVHSPQYHCSAAFRRTNTNLGRAMTNQEDSGTSAQSALVVGAVVGLFSFLVIFGFERAAGIDGAYLWPAGDFAQHVAGAFAYIDGSWAFPIFHTERINAPDGVNIIFTDSAPFAGLLAKIVHSLTGLRFNYLGAWFALSWVGQAMAGAYLMKQLAGRTLFLYICGAVIALSWPAYLNRHFHLALGSHCLLVFALGLYFSTTRFSLKPGHIFAWTCLLGVAIWTHAYLFVMSAALFAAALADGALRGVVGTKRAAVTFFGVLVFCAMLALVGGYATAGNVNAGGYGAFRMDLLAYFWPHGSALFPTPAIFDPQSAFEGYNYLGLGGLIAAFAAILFIRRQHLTVVGSHPVLLIALTGMTLFAITNAVSFAGHILIHPSLPTDTFPFSTFRASGRFGWPLGYLIVFAGFAFLTGALGKRYPAAAVSVIGVLVALQVVDSSQLLKGMRDGWASPQKPLLEAALQNVESVHFAPPIDCLAAGPIQNAAIEALAVVARKGIASDDAHVARSDLSRCNATSDQTDSNVLVIATPNTPEAQNFVRQRQCTEEAGILICASDRRAGRPLELE